MFIGEVLEYQRPQRPVLLVETVLKGWKLQVGTTVELRFDGWWPPHLSEGDRHTVPALSEWVPEGSQTIHTEIHTSSFAPITEPIDDPAAYGVSVLDSVHPPSSWWRSRQQL